MLERERMHVRKRYIVSLCAKKRENEFIEEKKYVLERERLYVIERERQCLLER